jgi:type III restriction enzyme
MAQDYLYKTINSQKEAILKFSPEALTIPEYITSNIKFPMFDWQLGALQNFLYYENPKSELKNEPTHLLFNMATGTGKTLLMAALILYYYDKGYRHFLFFVNQNNIVGKTEDNLTDPAHNKYLFSNPIVINDKSINVKKVDTFSDKTEDIEILFTSIHKLHNSVYQVKENSIFLEDLQKRKIVMLADEAHHLNSDTKKKKGQLDLEVITELPENASAEMIEKSWEHTVTKLILQKEGATDSEENKNVLLEFTATVPTDESVVKKYIDKTIYRFELKDFLKAGYTKEINLVSSSFIKKQRVLQALLFNWFRYEIAIKNNLPNFKPVILFRSKFVDEKNPENVQEDYDFFREVIDNLTQKDFDFLSNYEIEQVDKVYEMGQSRIVDISKYIAENKLNYSSIITYLKDAFKDSNCIITHSKDKKAVGRRAEDKTTPEQDKLLNSLEDKQNPITAIFTCQRLTEGWDVLNLYDIVRMYEGQNTGGSNKGAAGKSTVSEVQLIGRGVRYYPFEYEDKIRNKRKFDKALTNELRVLEEFFFHSDKDERYIAELKKELKRQELLPEKDKQLKIFDIKPEIKEDKNSFYHKVKIYKNDRKPNPNKKKRSLEDLKKDWGFEYKIIEKSISETTVNFEDKAEDKTRLETATKEGRTLTPKINEVERHILYKALNIHSKRDQSILRFNKLKEELDIEQTDDLFKDEFIGGMKLKISVPSKFNNFSDIPNNEQVAVLTAFFNQFAEELSKISHPFIGSEFEAEKFKTYYEIPKAISVVEDPESNDLERELKDKDWYALTSFYGTSEEKGLVKFLKETMDNFKDKYEDINLLRNEEVYKIYDFDEGRGFMPDFLLFLKSKGKNMYYQVFIEPKGSQFKDATGSFENSKEGWKDKFLTDISSKYAGTSILKSENKEYKLVGLPLYNISASSNFKKSVNEHLEIEI